MPVNPMDRPFDVLRSETVDRLIMNYGHGRLSLEAFQRRLDDAYEATTHEALTALTDDLDLQVDAGYEEHKRRALAARYAEPAEAESEVEYVIDILGGSDRGGDWVVPAELRVITILGGGDIDLTDARFASRSCRIRVLCLFGGVTVYVPEGVNVAMRTFNVAGGSSNKTPGTLNPDAPRVLIDGLVMFGGIDVKMKRTLKERMLELADGVRTLLGQAPAR